MDTFSTLALVTGVGWASGVRLYALIFFLGVLHNTGVYVLPHNLQVLAHPAVMTASGLLFAVEFFADKLPGFDSLWDAVHTFIRIPAAALLGAAAIVGGDPGLVVAAGLLSGAIAAGTHLTKAGSRVLINASPEPLSNWVASFSEDALALAGVWTALKYPMLFLLLLVAFLLLVLWLLPRLWRGIKRVFATIGRLSKISV